MIRGRLRRLAIIGVLSTALTGYGTAQKMSFRGRIATDSSKGLEDCYVKISEKQGGRILAFFNTGKTDSFSIDIPFHIADSFFVSATHVGYGAASVSQYISEARIIHADLVMPLLTNSLGQITIKAPPVWVRGDTTFFNAGAFEDGNDRKLIDILVKMPGFELDAQGNLLYKKKMVEKVMIDGEEIFADKLKLMMNNFPVHVISTVQAIENQSSDRLTRGLVNDNKVFLNLGLNKEKLKAAFGDGEVGIGTANRYLVNPVLFSLYGKLKLGYIGNWNNIGNGIDWKEQAEFKKDQLLMGENWMMNSNQLQLINGFESRRYITNGQTDNRFQLNIPINKSLKSTLEFNFVKDRQTQTTYDNSAIYSGNTFIRQNDSSNIRNLPYLLSVYYKMDWQMDSTRELKTSTAFYHNGSGNNTRTIYNTEGTIDTTQNSIGNNWDSYAVTANYTHRISLSKAEKWSATFAQHFYSQSCLGNSSSWPTVYGLPDPMYTALHQHLNNRSITANADWTLLRKTKTGVFVTGITASWLSSKVISRMYLSDPEDTLVPQVPNGYSNSGLYNVASIIGNMQKSVRLLQSPVLFKAELGFSNATKEEDSTRSRFVTPVYKLSMDWRDKWGGAISNEINLSYVQRQAEPYKLYGILLPDGTNSFHRNLNVTLPIRMLDATDTWTYSLSKRIGTGLLLDYTRNYSGFTPINSLNQFVQIGYDSLIKLPAYNYYLSLFSNFYSDHGRSICNFNFGMNRNQGYVNQGEGLFKTNRTLYSLSVNIDPGFGDVYFLHFNTVYTYSVMDFPKELQNGVAQNVSSLNSRLLQRVRLTPLSNIVLTADWIDNNILTGQQSSFLFIDTEYNYTLPGKPISFILRLENITDQRYYRSANNSLLTQTFFTVPLVQRNLFLSVRYEL